MHVEVQPQPSGVVRVVVDGEFDLDNAHVLREALVGAALGTAQVEVLVRDLEFIDSTGLSALIAAHRVLSTRHDADQARLTLLEPPGHLLRLLETTGLADLFSLPLPATPR